MQSVTIVTYPASGEVDVIFPAPSANDATLQEDLHNNVLPRVDGARAKPGGVDGLIAIRKSDYKHVVQNLANVYRHRDWDVTIAPGS